MGSHRLKVTAVGISLAKDLIQEQLDNACGDDETKLPEGLTIKPCTDETEKPD